MKSSFFDDVSNLSISCNVISARVFVITAKPTDEFSSDIIHIGTRQGLENEFAITRGK